MLERHGEVIASRHGLHAMKALYLAHGAEHVGEPEVDETAEVRWVPVDETPAMIARGDIVGAITIIGVQHALLRRAAARVPPP